MFAVGRVFPNFVAFETAMKELAAHQNAVFIRRSSNQVNLTHVNQSQLLGYIVFYIAGTVLSYTHIVRNK